MLISIDSIAVQHQHHIDWSVSQALLNFNASFAMHTHTHIGSPKLVHTIMLAHCYCYIRLEIYNNLYIIYTISQDIDCGLLVVVMSLVSLLDGIENVMNWK